MHEGLTRVLFLGNSYTYVNDLPRLFAMLCHSNGRQVAVDSITVGGHRRQGFQQERDPLCAQLRETLAARHFDFAVLQEQSQNPILHEEQFLESVGALQARIPADHFVLYATWSRNDGSPELKEMGLTMEQMTEKLSLAYRKAAQLYGMRVAEVGKAFYRHEKRNDLYDTDRSHPSPAGSALAAHIIWETITSF